MVPTDAMVEAATGELTDFTDGTVHWGDYSPALAAQWIVQRAIAAAPPEWLLRAALTENELDLMRYVLTHVPEGYGDYSGSSLYKKLSRALRGGEQSDA